MQNNVIAFDRNRKPARRATSSLAAAAENLRDNVVSIAEWKNRARAMRTANGVFFTTAVLCTFGSAA